jgi:hypothetical protein
MNVPRERYCETVLLLRCLMSRYWRVVNFVGTIFFLSCCGDVSRGRLVDWTTAHKWDLFNHGPTSDGTRTPGHQGIRMFGHPGIVTHAFIEIAAVFVYASQVQVYQRSRPGSPFSLLPGFCS